MARDWKTTYSASVSSASRTTIGRLHGIRPDVWAGAFVAERGWTGASR